MSLADENTVAWLSHVIISVALITTTTPRSLFAVLSSMPRCSQRKHEDSWCALEDVRGLGSRIRTLPHSALSPTRVYMLTSIANLGKEKLR